MPSPEPIRVAVIGGGMFFAEIIGPTLRDLERFGLAPYLGSLGQGRHARDLAPVPLELVAVGTHSPARGTAGRIVDWYREAVPGSVARAYYGETVWEEILAEAAPGDRFVFGVSEDVPRRGVDTLLPLAQYVAEHGRLPLKG